MCRGKLGSDMAKNKVYLSPLVRKHASINALVNFHRDNDLRALIHPPANTCRWQFSLLKTPNRTITLAIAAAASRASAVAIAILGIVLMTASQGLAQTQATELTDTRADSSLDSATALAISTAIDNGNPVVAVMTNLGPLHFELLPKQAPKSVDNFKSYIASSFYDGTVFHRVIEGFMIQGGGFDLRLESKNTRAPIANEADNKLKNSKFTIAMARTADPDSATAQFFINVADNDFLNHKSKTPSGWGYAVFGRMIGGMRVAEWMSKVPTGPEGPFESEVPLVPLVIESMKLL